MAFFLIYIIFILSFTKGILELIGIPETLLQLGIEVLIILLFSIAFLRTVKFKKFVFPGTAVIFSLFVIVTISYSFNDVDLIQTTLFFRKFGFYILFFYSIFNVTLTQIQKDKLLSLLIFLFLIQIPAALIKLFVLGGTLEKIVGTMSVMEGSLATTMPLLPIAYLISHYLNYKKIKDIVFVLLFISIGLISNKLGILFYVIILFLFLSYFHSSPKLYLPNFKFIKNILINSIYLTIIFSLFVILNPRANPEHKVGGSIDLDYLIEFTQDYQTLDLQTGVEGDGRFDAPFVALDRLYNGGLLNVLFGFGPGDIVQSSLTKYDNPLLEKYNIGYGGRLGLVWFLMQVGVVGTVLFILFHLYLLKRLFVIYRVLYLDSNAKVLTLTAIGFSLLFFLDFLTYSPEMIHSPGVTLTYYFGIFYILSTFKNQINYGAKND